MSNTNHKVGEGMFVAFSYRLTNAENGDLLFEAKENGVEVFAVDCKVTADGIFADEQIPVCFS